MMCARRMIMVVLVVLSLGSLHLSAKQFQKAVYYHAGQRPFAVVTGHFTQSGNLDLAFADWLSNQVVILLGNGDGTFQAPRKVAAAAPIELAAGDFNEDGNVDLAVVESRGTGDGSLAIFLGDGQGGFKLSTSYPIGPVSGFVAVADFDGDGHLDAAVSDQGVDSTPGDVIVFFGNGKGSLRRVAKFKMLHQQPTGIAAGDLNGNHHPDLAVTLAGSGSVAVLLNDGTGHFKKPVSYDAGGGEAVDVKIADLRNNGKQDLVIANLSQGMVVLLNQGDGTFGKATIYPPCSGSPPCEAPQAVTVADFNLDGHLDAAVATNIDDSYFYYGKGDGTFGLAKHLKNTIKFQGGFSIASGDFNGDNAPDLAIPIQNKGKVAVLLNAK